MAAEKSVIDELLTREEVARILNKKPSWLRYAERKKLIPFVKVGQAIRYRPSDILGWIETHVVSGHSADDSLRTRTALRATRPRTP
jgi:hypothetical protein